VERPASVVKELVENAIDAGAGKIAISIVQGGRKLVAVQDDGCGMSREDALLSLERQATSKIRDVNDIEEIDTLGFRGEAIPSIASVSRFSLTTRRADSDEGTFLQVNAGTLAETRAAGCPAGTLVEVRDLFCNVPARRKFLRAYATEESHVKKIFTDHALAHPSIGFSLTMDGRELYRLAPASKLRDRVRDLFGDELLESFLPLEAEGVTGYIEKPNLSTPTRHDQYVFVNGRPASSPSIAYAIREAYPRRPGDVRPAAVIFLTLPPNQVDVNVHPTKREVRFRDNTAVKQAIENAISSAIAVKVAKPEPPAALPKPEPTIPSIAERAILTTPKPIEKQIPLPTPEPIQPEINLQISDDGVRSSPWQSFTYLAQSESGYLLIETESGIVTINPHAARERIAYERLIGKRGQNSGSTLTQTLLIPETVKLTPVEAARISASLECVRGMGFQIEPFGTDTFKIDAVPQLVSGLSPGSILATIARDLAEGGGRRSGEHWREELIAKSIARSFAGAELKLTRETAVRLVEDLCATKMPYVCPRGKPVMIFTSTRELDRKFDRK